jgi:selenoprotein W-related protein
MLKIKITYCAVWHYTERAASLAADLLRKHEFEIETITLIPSDGGRFEVEVNGSLAYSKIQLKRHAEPSEVLSLIEKQFLSQ